MRFHRIQAHIVPGALVAALWLDVGFSQDLELDQTRFRSDIDSQSAGQGFGNSIDASGRWAVIGAPTINGGTGGAYLFSLDGDSWRFEKTLEIPPNSFNRMGSDVAIHGDWLAVALSRDVAMYFRDEGGTDNWGYHSTLSVADDSAFRSRNISNTVALTNGSLAIGAPETDAAPFSSDTDAVGSVLIYSLNARNRWGFAEQINIPFADQMATAKFGLSVDINSAFLAVASPSVEVDGIARSGKAWIYDRSGEGGSFELDAALTSDMPSGGSFGSEIAIGNGFIVVGSPAGAAELTPGISNDGSVYTFERSNGQWMMTNELTPSVPTFVNRFGRSVSVFENLLWTASDEATYLFRRHGDASWLEIDRNEAPVFPSPSNIFDFGTGSTIIRQGTRIHGIVGDAVAEDSENARVGAAFFYSYDDVIFRDGLED